MGEQGGGVKKTFDDVQNHPPIVIAVINDYFAIGSFRGSIRFTFFYHHVGQSHF